MGASSKERQDEVEYLLEDAIILPLTKEISIKSAEIYNQLKKKNQIIEFRDIFIAATAIHHQLPIKTLNKKHFNRIEGLELL
jgi:tRNA(fMet)-specific endonuclease VapC